MKRQTSIVLGILLAGTAWAGSPTGGNPLTIRVLSAKTEAFQLSSGANGVPKDCNLMEFSAYCEQSRSVVLRNTMFVEDSSGKSFAISCTVDSRWSKCVSLAIGETLGARNEKNGLMVWYRNPEGKEVKQSYALVPAAGNPVAAPGSEQDSPAANQANSGDAPAAPAIPESNRSVIKCNFTSTPSGAEITLDGRYVGNTPSIVAVSPGQHAVVLFVPGFSRWDRELTVSSGSDVSVRATLEKIQ